MPTNDLSGTTALVTGASRGFGRGIATALSKAGAHVVGVARDQYRLEDLRSQLGETFTPVVADAADPITAGRLIDTYRPRTLVLSAGANPLNRPIHHHTWQTFSRNWEVDVQQVFHWTREALLRPLAAGSVMIALSSGAAVGGSPLTPATDLGASAVTAYAARQGTDVAAFVESLDPTLSPEDVGNAITDLATADRDRHDAYLLTPAGLTSLG